MSLPKPNPETTSPMSPNQSYSYPPPTPSDGVSLTPISYGAPPPAEAPTWGYSAAERNNAFPPSLPSIQTFGRANSEAWQQNEGNSEMAPYRPWTAEPGYYNNTSPTDNREMSWPPQGPPTYSRETSEESATFAPTYMPASNQSTKSSSVIPPLPRHTYTRTLVGPLSANATVLQDEHRKPGIFFLFQDLSVRTEGGGFGIMFPFHRSDQSQRYLPSANASHECRRVCPPQGYIVNFINLTFSTAILLQTLVLFELILKRRPYLRKPSPSHLLSIQRSVSQAFPVSINHIRVKLLFELHYS